MSWELGGLTYGYADEEGLEEGIVVGDVLENPAVVRYVYENRQGILGYRLDAERSICRLEKTVNGGNSAYLVILHEELQILYGRQLAGLEYRRLLFRIRHQVLGSWNLSVMLWL